MAKLVKKRVCAELEGDFVVFLLGSRITNPFKFWKWYQLGAAMKAMRTELAENPELGMLHAQDFYAYPDLMTVQYWRSFEHLERYARAREHQHLPAWQNFYKTIGMNDDVGIWHETYLVKAGQYEAIYGSVPAMGLGLAGTLFDAVGAKQDARQRIKAAA